MSRNHSFARLIVAWALLSIGAAACGTGATQSRRIRLKPASQPTESSGLAYRSLQGRRRVAQAVAGHSSFARRMDLGILRRCLRRKSGPNLGRHARRAAAAEGRRSVDALRGAQSVPRELYGQLGRLERNVPAGDQAGVGAPVPALDHRVRSPGQPRRRVAAPRRDVRQESLRSRAAPDQDQPLRHEKHVWIIDDQLHMIYRFTYDGKLVHSKGQLGIRGRGPNTFDRPTDIAWLPDGTYFITDGYGGTRVAKYDTNDNFIMDWGGRPRIPRTPDRTSGIRSTASRSAPTAGSSSSTADMRGCRSSTRTASSSICGRSGHRTGRPVRTRSW